IRDKKEALLMLAHFVGDLHQPLHVGAIYLTSKGKEVDADAHGVNADATSTHGGNAIQDEESQSNLHSEWDAMPESLAANPTDADLDEARGVTTAKLPAGGLAAAWATDAVIASHDAWADMTFTGQGSHHWLAHFRDRDAYMQRKADLQRRQILAAG